MAFLNKPLSVFYCQANIDNVSIPRSKKETVCASTVSQRNNVILTGSGAVPAENTSKIYTDKTQATFPTFNLCFPPPMTFCFFFFYLILSCQPQ